MQVGNKIILILSQATIPGFFPLEMPGSAFGPGGRQKIFSLSDNMFLLGSVMDRKYFLDGLTAKNQGHQASITHYLETPFCKLDNSKGRCHLRFSVIRPLRGSPPRPPPS